MRCPCCQAHIPDANTRPACNRVAYLISVILGIFGLASSCATALGDATAHALAYVVPLIDRSEFTEIFFRFTEVAAVLFIFSSVFFAFSILFLTASVITAISARKPRGKAFKILLPISIVALVLCGNSSILLRGFSAWMACGYCRGASEPNQWMFIGMIPLFTAFLGLFFALVMGVVAAVFMRKGNRFPMVLSIISLLLPPLFGVLALIFHTLIFASSVSFICALLVALVLVHAIP